MDSQPSTVFRLHPNAESPFRRAVPFFTPSLCLAQCLATVTGSTVAGADKFLGQACWDVTPPSRLNGRYVLELLPRPNSSGVGLPEGTRGPFDGTRGPAQQLGACQPLFLALPLPPARHKPTPLSTDASPNHLRNEPPRLTGSFFPFMDTTLLFLPGQVAVAASPHLNPKPQWAQWGRAGERGGSCKKAVAGPARSLFPAEGWITPAGRQEGPGGDDYLLVRQSGALGKLYIDAIWA